MSAAAEFVSERIGTIRLVVWAGFALLVTVLVAAVLGGLYVAGPYEGVPDRVAFLAFVGAALVGTAATVAVSVASA